MWDCGKNIKPVLNGVLCSQISLTSSVSSKHVMYATSHFIKSWSKFYHWIFELGIVLHLSKWNIMRICFVGPSAADEIVTAAKECFRQRGHEHYPVSPSAPHPDDLPPPYSPTGSSLPFRTPPQNYLSPPHSSTNPFDTRRHSTPHSLPRRSPGENRRSRHHPETYDGRD